MGRKIEGIEGGIGGAGWIEADERAGMVGE